MTRFVAVVGMIWYELFDSRYFLKNLPCLQPIWHRHVAKSVLLVLVNPVKATNQACLLIWLDIWQIQTWGCQSLTRSMWETADCKLVPPSQPQPGQRPHQPVSHQNKTSTSVDLFVCLFGAWIDLSSIDTVEIKAILDWCSTLVATIGKEVRGTNRGATRSTSLSRSRQLRPWKNYFLDCSHSYQGEYKLGEHTLAEQWSPPGCEPLPAKLLLPSAGCQGRCRRSHTGTWIEALALTVFAPKLYLGHRQGSSSLFLTSGGRGRNLAGTSGPWQGLGRW